MLSAGTLTEKLVAPEKPRTVENLRQFCFPGSTGLGIASTVAEAIAAWDTGKPYFASVGDHVLFFHDWWIPEIMLREDLEDDECPFVVPAFWLFLLHDSSPDGLIGSSEYTLFEYDLFVDLKRKRKCVGWRESPYCYRPVTAPSSFGS